jgi:hypothetical protein
MIQEFQNDLWRQDIQRKLVRTSPVLGSPITKEEPERVPVRSDRCLADVALAGQVLTEEAL